MGKTVRRSIKWIYGRFCFPGTCPGALFLGRMSERMTVHRNRCGIVGFPGRLSGILFMQLYRCDCFCFLGRSSRALFMHRLGAFASRLAGAVIEIGSDLRISPYLSDTSQPTLGRSLRRGHIGCRGWGQYSLCNSGAGRSSPLRCDVWVLCVRAEIACVSVGMLGLNRMFFICADGKKTALVSA